MNASGKKVAVGFKSRCKANLSRGSVSQPLTMVKMYMASVVYDVLGEVDTAGNQRWDAAAAGVYRITAAIRMTGLAANEGVILRIYKNGAYQNNQLGGLFMAGVEDAYAMVSGSFELLADDYIEIYALHTHSVAIAFGAYSWCTIERFA